MKSNRNRRKWRRRGVSILSGIVVFATTYALVLPAITLDQGAAAVEPGLRLAESFYEEPEADVWEEPEFFEYDDDILEEDSFEDIYTEEEPEQDDVPAADASNYTGSEEAADNDATETPDSGEFAEADGNSENETAVTADEPSKELSAEMDGSEIEMPAQTFEAKLGGERLKVTVEAAEGALPAGSSMRAEFLTDETGAVALRNAVEAVVSSATEGALPTEAEAAVSTAVKQAVETFAVVKLSFVNAEGAVTAPVLPVRVTFAGAEIASAEETEVFCFDDAGNARRVTLKEAWELDAPLREDEVVFDAEKDFSFAVVGLSAASVDFDDFDDSVDFAASAASVESSDTATEAADIVESGIESDGANSADSVDSEDFDNFVDSATSVASVESSDLATEAADIVESDIESDRANSADSVDPIDTADSMDRVDFVDSVDSMDSVDSVDSVGSVDLVDSVDSTDSVDSMDFVESVASVESVESVESMPEMDDAETEMPELFFHAELEDGGLIVDVDAPEGALPLGTSMSVMPIYEQSVFDVIADAVDGSVTTIVAVDITFIDMDGGKIEPACPIRVTMTSAAIAEAEQTTIVHLDDDGDTEVIAPADAEIAEALTEGQVAFEAEAFSVYAIVGTIPGTEIQMTVGSTETIEPNYTTTYNSYSWETSDKNIVSIESGKNSKDVTVKAVSEGTAQLTLTYVSGTGKKARTYHAYYSVTTIALTDADSTAQVYTDEYKTVSVKETGNLKKISDYHVVVEDADDEYTGDDVLKAYHIYLADSEGNEVPTADLGNGTLNLKVTLTYDTLPDWFTDAKTVKHYKNDAEQFISGIRFDLDSKTISFIVHGFSLFVIGDDNVDTDSDPDDTDGVTLHFSTGTLSADNISNYDNSGSNQYAIATVGGYQTVNGASIIKYIEPTDIEDVFKVTVGVERGTNEQQLIEILTSMPAYIINENKNAVDSPVGTILDPKEYQNGDTYGYYDANMALDPNHYFFVNYSYEIMEDGQLVRHTVGPIKMYRVYGTDAGTNHGIVGILPNGKWIVIDTANFKWRDHGTHEVALTQSQYEELLEEATGSFTSTGVTDYLDLNRFVYLGTSLDDFSNTGTTHSEDVPAVSLADTSATAPDENGVITWNGNGFTSIKGGSSATMTYYVRLKTSDMLDANSDIDIMNSSGGSPISSSGTAYDLANSKATAVVTVSETEFVPSSDTGNAIQTHTTTTTIEATEPSVKGLLYYIRLLKQKDEGDGVKNAFSDIPFKIYQNSYNPDNPQENLVNTFTTDSTGYGISTKGLPWGTYVLVEDVPDGYSAPNGGIIGTYNIGYLGNSQGTWIHDQVAENKLGKLLDGENAIVNKRNIIEVEKKVIIDKKLDPEFDEASVDQTIYIALWDDTTGGYLLGSDGKILVKPIIIQDGAVVGQGTSANYVVFGIDEALPNHKYYVSELVKTEDINPDDISRIPSYEDDNHEYVYYFGNLTFIGKDSQGNDAVFQIKAPIGHEWNFETETYNDSGRMADLSGANNQARVKFDNIYTPETTIEFVAQKQWGRRTIAADGKWGMVQLPAALIPKDAQVTITLYQQIKDSDWTPYKTITLDGTADDNGETTSAGSNIWRATFTDLPKFDTDENSETYGEPYHYRANETAKPDEFEPFDAVSDHVPMGQHGNDADDYILTGGIIYNIEKSTEITVKKVDDKNVFLPGASFRLLGPDINNHETLIKEFTVSDEGGFTIDNLVSGDYKLVEIAAPDGYIILANTIEFSVNAIPASGENVITWKGGTVPKNVSSDSPSTTTNTGDTITVVNTPGSPLPNTGGPGTLPYTLGGILLMLGAALMYGFRMRRRERRLN